jgi:tryptophan synthase alpha chain
LLFSYLNPLLRYGFDNLARDAAAAGVDGVLLTDLSVEEAAEPVSRLRSQSLDTVFLAAPTSSERRLRLVAEHSSGFVYLVSRTGVTGEQPSLAASAARLTERMRQLTQLPLALGFGVSTPEQVAEVARLADGVVVGSAIVRFIEANSASPDLAANLEAFTRQLTSPLHSS